MITVDGFDGTSASEGTARFIQLRASIKGSTAEPGLGETNFNMLQATNLYLSKANEIREKMVPWKFPTQVLGSIAGGYAVSTMINPIIGAIVTFVGAGTSLGAYGAYYLGNYQNLLAQIQHQTNRMQIELVRHCELLKARVSVGKGNDLYTDNENLWRLLQSVAMNIDASNQIIFDAEASVDIILTIDIRARLRSISEAIGDVVKDAVAFADDLLKDAAKNISKTFWESIPTWVKVSSALAGIGLIVWKTSPLWMPAAKAKITSRMMDGFDEFGFNPYHGPDGKFSDEAEIKAAKTLEKYVRFIDRKDKYTGSHSFGKNPGKHADKKYKLYPSGKRLKRDETVYECGRLARELKKDIRCRDGMDMDNYRANLRKGRKIASESTSPPEIPPAPEVQPEAGSIGEKDRIKKTPDAPKGPKGKKVQVTQEENPRKLDQSFHDRFPNLAKWFEAGKVDIEEDRDNSFYVYRAKDGKIHRLAPQTNAIAAEETLTDLLRREMATKLRKKNPVVEGFGDTNSREEEFTKTLIAKRKEIDDHYTRRIRIDDENNCMYHLRSALDLSSNAVRLAQKDNHIAAAYLNAAAILQDNCFTNCDTEESARTDEDNELSHLMYQLASDASRMK